MIACCVEVEMLDDAVEKEDRDMAGTELDLSHLVSLNRDTFKYKEQEGVVLFHIRKCKSFTSSTTSLAVLTHSFFTVKHY